METKTKRKYLKMALGIMACIGLTAFGIYTAAEIMEGDPDDDPRFFREIRLDSWARLIGDEEGIINVREKLIRMYGENAPEVKVDLANPDYTEGNWHYEFENLAYEAIEKEDYFAASGYFAIAAYPFMYQDHEAAAIYNRSLTAFELALIAEEYPYKVLHLNIGGSNIKAYLVYPQSFDGSRSVPAVLTTGGMDGLMPFYFTDYLSYWNEAGIAWVGFDNPGNGGSHELILTGDHSTDVHEAVIRALLQEDGIDWKNIFINSRSYGGYNVLRLVNTGKADELDLAGVIANGAIGRHLFTTNWYGYFTLDDQTKSVWGARCRIDPNDYFAMLRSSRDMRVAEKGPFWNRYIAQTPLLVHNSCKDQMNPVREIKQMARLSENGAYLIEWDEEEHCTSREAGLVAAAEFVHQHLR